LVEQVRRLVRGTPSSDVVPLFYVRRAATTDRRANLQTAPNRRLPLLVTLRKFCAKKAPAGLFRSARRNEYNIAMRLSRPDLRMRNHKGAVFDVLIIAWIMIPVHP